MRAQKIDSSTEWLVGELGALGGVEARRMFGGQGLYRDDAMFAIVYEGRFYFKVDDDTRPQYESFGSHPFQPRPSQTLRSFYEVPADVLEDRETLHAWASRAIQAAARSKSRAAR